MRLKMLLDTVGQWWRPVNGTVSMLDLIMAKVQVKLSAGLTYILFPVDRAMLKIRSAVYDIQFQAKETIARRNIEQIKPVEFGWSNSPGFVAQTIPSSFMISTTLPTNNMISFNNKESKPVLVITNDGDVEWHGKPSEAADALVRTFQFTVEDKKGITKAARRRYYYKACKNILNKAEKMESKEFIAFLQKQVYNKERRVIMDELKGEE
jgi:hypothetical protein